MIDVINILRGDGEKLSSPPPTPIKSLKTLIKNYSSNHHRKKHES